MSEESFYAHNLRVSEDWCFIEQAALASEQRNIDRQLQEVLNSKSSMRVQVHLSISIYAYLSIHSSIYLSRLCYHTSAIGKIYIYFQR